MLLQSLVLQARRQAFLIGTAFTDGFGLPKIEEGHEFKFHRDVVGRELFQLIFKSSISKISVSFGPMGPPGPCSP